MFAASGSHSRSSETATVTKAIVSLFHKTSIKSIHSYRLILP